MNSKVRALVWEEIRVGGAIVATLFTVSLMILGIIRGNEYMGAQWMRSAESCLVVVLGVPMLCSLLLALNLRNSGDLGGGFSGRILRLPVDTGTAVAVQLFMRLSGVVLLTLLLSLASYLLFGHGGGWQFVLLMAGVYLFVQTVDWSRAVLGIAAWAMGALAVLVPLFMLGPGELWRRLVAVGEINTTEAVAVFAAGAFVLAGLSWTFVQWTRRGARVELLSGARAALDAPSWARGTMHSFASPQSALFTYEMRRVGLYLPKAALVCWVLGVAIFWLGTMYVAAGPNTVGRHAYALLFALHVMPLLAVLLASLTWPLATASKLFRKGGQRVDWAMRIPATRQERALARLKVAGVNLGVTLGVAGALHAVSLLLYDDPSMGSILGNTWAHGETTLREMVVVCIGPVLVTGLMAWMAMTFMPALAVALVVGLLAAVRAAEANVAGWEVLFLPVALLVGMLLAAVVRGWIAGRTALKNVVLWVAVAALLFPFATVIGVSSPTEAADWGGTALLCLCAATWLAFGWVWSLAWPVGGRRGGLRWRDLVPENRAQHGRNIAARPFGRRPLQALALAAVALLLIWLRWPAEPAGRMALEKGGIPTTPATFDGWYAAVPDAENLAARYGEAIGMVGPLEASWSAAQGLPALAGPAERRSQLDNILFLGNAKVARTAAIPKSVWDASRNYWNTVSRPVVEKLHETAALGLTRSRYPIDLRKGQSVELPHLAPLRELARLLALDAWVAAMERRPDDAVNDVLDTLPIADSLADEPLLISQLVRIALDGIAVNSLETSLNRAEFSEEQLARVQHRFETALPPLSQGPFMDRGLGGEAALFMTYSTYLQALDANSKMKGTLLQEMTTTGTVQILGNLFGADPLTATLYAGSFRALKASAQAAAQTGCAPDTTVAEQWTRNNLLFFRAPMYAVGMGGFTRVYESEWRVRTQFDVARTALAVERFRLANSRFPERLEEMVPAFLERVPTDPWNHGKPLSYRVKENREFVVYCFAKNGTDENGEEVTDTKKSWWRDGDMTFTVAPVEMRRQPQVAEEGTGT